LVGDNPDPVRPALDLRSVVRMKNLVRDSCIQCSTLSGLVESNHIDRLSADNPLPSDPYLDSPSVHAG